MKAKNVRQRNRLIRDKETINKLVVNYNLLRDLRSKEKQQVINEIEFYQNMIIKLKRILWVVGVMFAAQSIAILASIYFL